MVIIMKTVLIVDDSAFMRRTMKNIVVNNEYDVIAEAKNGMEAIVQYKKHKPDIVTLDVVMKEMDGIDALRQLMKIDPEANVIMVTSMGQDIMVRDAIIIGAKNYILKPFNEEQVITAFEKLDESPVM